MYNADRVPAGGLISIALTGFSEVELLALLDSIAADAGDLSPVSEVPPVESGDSSPEADLPPTNEPTKKPQPDWSWMPEFTQPDAGPFRTLLVHFKDQAAVDAFSTLIGQRLTDKTKYVWHPQYVKAVTPEVVYA